MSTGDAHIHQVTIYYEDTDFSGYVYHPNYLKYFERAREHMIGIDVLTRMYTETGIGFVVYRCEMTFKAPAVHGDRLDVHSLPRLESPYRVLFDHKITNAKASDKVLVTGVVEMVCVDRKGQLVALPEHVQARLRGVG